MSALAGYRNSNGGLHLRLVLAPVLALALIVTLVSCGRRDARTSEKSAADPASGDVVQKTFASPAAAGQALFEAASNGDQNALMAVFGPEGRDLVYSGDAVKDRNAMRHFVDAYSQMHRWSKRESGDEILYVGADNLAFPIPLSRNASGQWVFNTVAGKNEVLARRIGEGELTAINVLTEVANAQQDYFARDHQFAQKLVSDEGQQNGLYWPVAEGQRPSPLGPLADTAKALGYSRSDKPQPFIGYYYRILTKQGSAAKGGAKDYVVNGKMTGGFAILAWPAKYRDSGIMTFMAGQDGVIYQRDLGENTSQVAPAITAYNPGEGWKVVLAPESPRQPTD